MSTDLENFIHGLYSVEDQHKVASADLDDLSLQELEAVLGLDIDHAFEKEASMGEVVMKTAYHGDPENFLKEFEGTPLYSQAIALCEKSLQAEAESIRRRKERQQQFREEDSIYDVKDQLRLQKSMLRLKLHKLKAGGVLPTDVDDDDDDEGIDKESSLAWTKLASTEAAEIQGGGNVEYGGDTVSYTHLTLPTICSV